MIGEELLKNQLAEKSIPFYEKALEQAQGQLVYFLRLGVANVRGQRYERAREVFTQALQRYPDNPNLYFLLGYTGRAEGQYDQAVAAFKQALKLQPDNPDVLSNLGYIASQRGENVEAERLLRRAIQLDPKRFPSYHDLGRLLVKLRRYEEALPLLNRGVELNSKDPGVHYQLFLAYSRLKKKDEAERELAEFKRLDEVNRHGATPLSADDCDKRRRNFAAVACGGVWRHCEAPNTVIRDPSVCIMRRDLSQTHCTETRQFTELFLALLVNLATSVCFLYCSPQPLLKPITKVDPPSWWANHTINPVRLLVRGTNLSGARVSSPNPELRVSRVSVNERGTYLFVDVEINPSLLAGQVSAAGRDASR